MKRFLASLVVSVSLVFAFAMVWADELIPEFDSTIGGTVVEVLDVEHYTYLRLAPRDGEIWAAVPTSEAKVGDKVEVVNFQSMDGFESRTLHRRFDRIVFGQLAGDGKGNPAGPEPRAMPHDANHGMAAMHGAAAAAPAPVVGRVARADGPDAHTVVDIASQPQSLRDKPVSVRGQVVKYTADVMGRNWLHVRDGTGSAMEGTNDILVVTTDVSQNGDVVLVKGVVRTDRDFGAGYVFKVLIEEARLEK